MKLRITLSRTLQVLSSGPLHLKESYIIWSGVCASILIVALLVSPGERRAVRANLFLAALVFFLCLRLTIRFLFRSGYFPSANPFTTIGLSCDLLLGPCLYFYVYLLTRSQYPKGWRFLVHWIPGTVGILGSLPLFLLFQDEPTSFSPHQVPVQLGFFAWHLPSLVSVLAYSVASLWLLQNHGKQIREQFSSLNQINLTWLRWLCGILLLAPLGLLLQSPEEMSKSIWQSLAYVMLIYYVGYMGIRQPAIFQQSVDGRTDTNVDPLPQPIRPADAKLPLNSEEIWDSLQVLLETEQPFRRPNINLARLAEMLQVPSYQLSAVINHHGDCSFFDLINRVRVDAAKMMLLDESCTSNILEIGLESGFNSKSTFYHQFKKSTGKTPSEFRAEYQRSND